MNINLNKYIIMYFYKNYVLSSKEKTSRKDWLACNIALFGCHNIGKEVLMKMLRH